MSTFHPDSAPCIRFDIERDMRIGMPEAVFCEGKPRRALETLLERFADPAEKPILFTRLAPEIFHSLREGLQAVYDSNTSAGAPSALKTAALQASGALKRRSARSTAPTSWSS